MVLKPRYTTQQNHVFVDHMSNYRCLIQGLSAKDTKNQTMLFAQSLNASSLLLDRSVNGIAERLVYFDNLLAGVEFPFPYYYKDTFSSYYGKSPRDNDDLEPNIWETQHERRRKKNLSNFQKH